MNKLARAIFTAFFAVTVILMAAGCAGAGSSKVQDERFPDFQTVDLEGNNVTQNIFKGKKVTVINIWGTFCPPCIAEMPELGTWDKELASDVQIIGIVCDAEGTGDKKTAEAARKITEKSRAKFVNLLPDQKIQKYLENVEAVPTTIFVDSEGKIIGERVVGANVPKYKEVVAGLLK